MIGWPIEAALTSGCFSRVVVSTDDEEIADIASSNGAMVPFMRPSVLSGDHVTTVSVIQHAVATLVRAGEQVDAACCIYATAPFVTGTDLRSSYRRLGEDDLDYVVAVTRFSYPVQRALRISGQDKVAMCYPEYAATRSQDLEELWHDAGQFYWGRSAAWLAGRPILTGNAAGWRLPGYRVHDIDTPEDWLRAEIMFHAVKERLQTSG